MAVAAQTALPGESLYGVKRGIESAQVRLADDDSERGRTLLAQADTRLTELEQLAAGDGGREELIPATLDAFTDQSSDGVRSLLASYDRGTSGDAQRARDFTAASIERLDALEEQLPASARDELLAAGRTLTDLDLEVSSACPVCTGGITTTPGLPAHQRAPRPAHRPRHRRPDPRGRAGLGPGPHRHHGPGAAAVGAHLAVEPGAHDGVAHDRPDHRAARPDEDRPHQDRPDQDRPHQAGQGRHQRRHRDHGRPGRPARRGDRRRAGRPHERRRTTPRAG